jgi:hypothetical protein
MMRARKSLGHIARIGVLTLLCALISQAEDSKPSEYEVKAAYLYNFGRFVEWPAGASDTDANIFAICVLGQDPFGTALDATVYGESIGGKPVGIKRVGRPQDATGCRVLFIASSEQPRLRQILTALGQTNVLTVSDMPDFATRGGMIQFVLRDNKIRFEVDLAAAERARLSLSSELLKVAVAVRRSSQSQN